jgi:NADPH2:quinone reductase
VDVVIDPIAGDYVERSYGLLRPNGRLIVYGLSSMASADVPDQAGPAIEAINALTERTPDKTVKFFAGVDDESDHYHSDLTTLLNLVAEGKIKPIIGARFPLAEASAAHALLEKAAVPGKIILDVGNG